MNRHICDNIMCKYRIIKRKYEIIDYYENIAKYTYVYMTPKINDFFDIITAKDIYPYEYWKILNNIAKICSCEMNEICGITKVYTLMIVLMISINMRYGNCRKVKRIFHLFQPLYKYGMYSGTTITIGNLKVPFFDKYEDIIKYLIMSAHIITKIE